MSLSILADLAPLQSGAPEESGEWRGRGGLRKLQGTTAHAKPVSGQLLGFHEAIPHPAPSSGLCHAMQCPAVTDAGHGEIHTDNTPGPQVQLRSLATNLQRVVLHSARAFSEHIPRRDRFGNSYAGEQYQVPRFSFLGPQR